MDRTRRSILVLSVLIFLVCSSILVQAQTQKPNVESRPKQEAVEIYHENDDAGVDALNRDFYETQQFGTDFVAGH
ncbi:hypothetical protein H5410_059726 [Solanum commersonii]|uniref:Uncharacterized protein n=1 Tax=Solanum commersonii TaxID=4109 RepID=A0A9J5W3T5_SOLCO|nr:hypothetical protein H5410_059726 [Solanum commersonii]